MLLISLMVLAVACVLLAAWRAHRLHQSVVPVRVRRTDLPDPADPASTERRGYDRGI